MPILGCGSWSSSASKMNLRPYQQEAIAATETGWNNFSKQLLVLPTGAGKTVCFSALAHRRLQRGERSLILAHREELIEQAVAKLKAATGVKADVEKAERWASLDAPVVVASVQTLRGDRLARWPRDHFGQIIADEAHHSISSSWQQVLNHFDGHADVLGVTATPDRGDKRNLGTYYENVAYEIGLFDLIKQGFLSRIVIKSIPLQIDLSRVQQTSGDYDANQLGDALTPYLGAIARAICENAPFPRRTLAFLPLIKTSLDFVAACRKEGLVAEHIDGYDDQRDTKKQRFAAGEFDLLSNAMLLTEGFDDPGIDCIVNLRPTRSRSLYSQIVGRGTRIADGKENLLLLDFLWAHQRMNLIRPAHLVSGCDDEAEVITKIAEQKAGGGEMDLEALATDAAEQRHESLRKKLEKNSKKKGKTIDAMEWCLNMNAKELVDYEPVMKWEHSQITDKQAYALKRAGIDVATVKGKGHASKLLDVYFRSQKLVLASDAQREKMRQMGVENWETATTDDARRFFADLRKPREAQLI